MWPWPQPEQTPWQRQSPTTKIWCYIKEGKCAFLSTITLNSWKCIKLWLNFFVLFERHWKLQLLVFLQPSALLITICVKFCLGNLNWIERAAILITILCAFFVAVRRPSSHQQRWPRRSRLTLKVARALTGSGMNADPPTHSPGGERFSLENPNRLCCEFQVAGDFFLFLPPVDSILEKSLSCGSARAVSRWKRIVSWRCCEVPC